MNEARIERLRAEGLVVEGDYSEINTVHVSKDGESHPLVVRPKYFSERNETVLFPLGTEKQSADESDDPRITAIGILRREEGGIGHKANFMNPSTEYTA